MQTETDTDELAAKYASNQCKIRVDIDLIVFRYG